MRLVDRARVCCGCAGTLGLVLAGVAACHVPDKLRSESDGGAGDAGIDTPRDTEAPETTLDQTPEPFSRLGQATFRFSSSDAGATFECRIDHEAPEPCL